MNRLFAPSSIESDMERLFAPSSIERDMNQLFGIQPESTP
jgi:hypothetical protein